MTVKIIADDVVAFWRKAGIGNWFGGGAAFDAQCREGYGEAHLAAARRELDDWADQAEGALALVLLLDQIPRNIYRGSAHAYATDGLARLIAGRAIAAGHDTSVDPALRVFFYMPLEHSEDIADQERSVALIGRFCEPDYLPYATGHRDVIVRFGRFPHRNAALGRVNTPDEQAWLDAGNGW